MSGAAAALGLTGWKLSRDGGVGGGGGVGVCGGGCCSFIFPAADLPVGSHRRFPPGYRCPIIMA